jgi:hypothetical protein
VIEAPWTVVSVSSDQEDGPATIPTFKKAERAWRVLWWTWTFVKSPAKGS